MRVLKTSETEAVSGGTFGLLFALKAKLFSRYYSRYNPHSYYTPPKKYY